MRISTQAKNINGSPTLTLNELANQLRAAGKPVINLTVGEPKNETPLNAIAKTQTRLDTRQIKYTAAGGIPAMKAAIRAYTLENYGRSPANENILVTVGAKQALVNALYAAVDPGDEVLVLAPYWVSYPEMIKLVGGIPVMVAPAAGQLTQGLAEIQAAVTPKTRAILFNSPNNPSGMVYPPELVAELVAFCQENEIYLIMDDIYHKLVFGSTAWMPAYEFSPVEIDSAYIIVVNGVSKTYGMTGFRIGWVIAPKDLIRAMTNIQGQTTSGVSVLTQEGAIGALEGDQTPLGELRALLNANRNKVIQFFDGWNAVTCLEPQGAFYCLPDFSALAPDSRKLAQFLLEKVYVAVVPGVDFGTEGHIRISYAGSASELDEGLHRIRWALDPESPRELVLGDQTITKDW